MKFNQLIIEPQNLKSKIIRSSLSNRQINYTKSLSNTNSSNTLIYDSSNKYNNSIIKPSFIQWTFSGIKSLLVKTAYEINYIDWEATDLEIEQEINNINQNIKNQAGNLISNGIITLITLGVGGYLSVQFPIIAPSVNILNQYNTLQLKSQFLDFINSLSEQAIKALALSSFLFVRQKAKSFLGWEVIENITEKIMPIPNKNLNNFNKGIFGGLFDYLFDITVNIIKELKEFFDQDNQSECQDQPIRTIEIFPDARSDESVIFKDRQENVERYINEYLSNHDLIKNRDLGILVGLPYDDFYTAKPQARKLILHYNGKEYPPYVDEEGNLTRRVRITIPFIKDNITWEDLKFTLPSFTWGNYIARGVLQDRVQMTVWGSSEEEARNTLLSLASLSTKSIIQISLSHMGLQHPTRLKQPTKVFVSWASLLVAKETTNATDYRLIDGENKAKSKNRINLWMPEKPMDYPNSF